jgi:acyl-CoA reductase-like NAD-dependent aldehyde dehydrogenase
MQPEPYGVVGVIGTWNYPLYLNLAPIAWALAAGNAVVWKPSELAPESALALAERFEQANLPVWTVLGDASTGRALCRAGCDKIAFTGSAATGRAILTELAATGTPSVMELSGNDAMIVCADAEAAIAARAAVWGRVANAGQTCASPQRIYVVPEVAAAFLQEAEAALGRLRPGVDYGPLRTEGFRQRVQAIVAGSVAQGACLLLGGSPLTDRPGFFYAPTLLADCRAGMPVAEQDFFGPVLAVFPVPNEAEAVIQANASALGLAASVWTRDPARGRQLATQLRVGLVSINEVVLDSGNPALPFGGARGSGFGKQRGALGLEEFVQWKVVASHPAGGARRHLFPYRPETLPILRGAIQLQAARGPIAKLQALQQLVAAAQQWRKRPRNDFPPDG